MASPALFSLILLNQREALGQLLDLGPNGSQLGLVVRAASSRTYTFSESLTHASWELRDLVHFLRHNVATGGDPVGLILREDASCREAHP